jgi:hypothetical protein
MNPSPSATLPHRPERVAGRHRPLLPGAALGVTTFLAYLPGLGRSLDFDSAETVGLFVRPGPPWAAFGRQSVFNNHPAFSFLEQLVRVVTGRSDAATMRLLPIAFGAIAVGVLTWLVARRHGLLAGLVAGATVAANPTFAGLSRSVRGYSLLTVCAIVSTALVTADRGREPGRSGRALGTGYVVVTAVGLVTHLYMVPVVAAHVGLLVATGRLDRRWRLRLLVVLLLSALAYAAMAGAMLEAATAHTRTFKPALPWRVASMATGGGWASVVLVPLVVIGGVATCRLRAAQGAALALGGVLLLLWTVVQSSALGERFFVWLVPGVSYLAAVAVARFPKAALLALGSVVLAVAALAPGYTAEPTAYRQAAAVIRDVNGSGGEACLVGVGVSPMLAYLDAPREFAAVTRPDELDRCDVVVVAAWWRRSTAPWFAADQAVIAAAERRFPHRLVLEADDPALVLSR